LVAVPVQALPPDLAAGEVPRLLVGGHEYLGMRAEIVVQRGRAGLHRADHKEGGQFRQADRAHGPNGTDH
jgi:hypothetical protein